MTDLEKPLGFPDSGQFGAQGLLLGASASKAALVLALLITYGLGFAALYPLTQASATQSAADGNDPMLHIGS